MYKRVQDLSLHLTQENTQMENKASEERCSIITRELKTRTISCCRTPTRRTEIGGSVTRVTPDAGQAAEQECRAAQPLWKTVWLFLRKLHVLLLCDPAATLLGSYPDELGLCPRRHLRTDVRDRASWKPPSWASVGKRRCIQTTEYYSVLKRKEL